MDVLEHFLCDRFAFGFEIGNLAADHAVDCPCGGRNLGKHRDAALGVDWCATDNFKSKREQRVASENRGGFAEFLVAGWFAASQVVVIEGRQIVVDQRIGVNEFNRARRMKRRGNVRFEYARSLEQQNRSNALAARKHAVAHRLMDRSWLRRFGREQFFEIRVDGDAVFFKKCWKLGWIRWHWSRRGRSLRGAHCSDSRSGSNGWATSFPSAFFRRISTLHSASSSCFWHSRESSTPSSKSFMASSRES